MAILLPVLICCLATIAVKSSPLPPINGPCPIVDCFHIEDRLPCPETERVRDTFRKNGHTCYGCLKCGDPFEEAVPDGAETRRGTFRGRPGRLPMCKDMDCSDYEELDCPVATRVRGNYTLEDGSECAGCLECPEDEDYEYDGDEEEGREGGEGGGDEGSEGGSEGEGKPAPPPPPMLPGPGAATGYRLGSLFECPQFTCLRINTNCREDLKQMGAFLSGGKLCFGCMRCRPGAPKLKPGEPAFVGKPMHCPPLDCKQVETQLQCPLHRRTNSVIVLGGITCPACRRCLRDNEAPIDNDIDTTKVVPEKTTPKPTTTTTTTTKRPRPTTSRNSSKAPCWLMDMLCVNLSILEEHEIPSWLDCSKRSRNCD